MSEFTRRENELEEDAKFKKFGDLIAEHKNKQILERVVESSRRNFEKYNFDFLGVEISEDLSCAKYEFSVKEDDQGWEDIMHGGVMAYNIDSTIAALALSRSPEGRVAGTRRLNLEYEGGSVVGNRYVIEIKLEEICDRDEIFSVVVKNSESGGVCVTGNFTFSYVKEIKKV